MSSGARFLLLGSGEFEPWAREVEEAALEGRARVVAISPLASAPEGGAVFERWASMGVRHYQAMGVQVRVLPLKTRRDAERRDAGDALAEVGMVFFSGGDPRFLADSLRGTPFLGSLRRAIASGVVFAGCSAGAMVAGREPTHRPRVGGSWAAGLGLVPGGAFGVHWNRVRFIPGMRPFVMSRAGEGWFAGIDERTAILGDGRAWRVYGHASVHLRVDGASRTMRAGEAFETPLGA
jgi:cyanophycinase